MEADRTGYFGAGIIRPPKSYRSRTPVDKPGESKLNLIVGDDGIDGGWSVRYLTLYKQTPANHLVQFNFLTQGDTHRMKQVLLVFATLVLVGVNSQIHPDIIEDAHLDAVSHRW